MMEDLLIFLSVLSDFRVDSVVSGDVLSVWWIVVLFWCLVIIVVVSVLVVVVIIVGVLVWR